MFHPRRTRAVPRRLPMSRVRWSRDPRRGSLKASRLPLTKVGGRELPMTNAMHRFPRESAAKTEWGKASREQRALDAEIVSVGGWVNSPNHWIPRGIAPQIEHAALNVGMGNDIGTASSNRRVGRREASVDGCIDPRALGGRARESTAGWKNVLTERQNRVRFRTERR